MDCNSQSTIASVFVQQTMNNHAIPFLSRICGLCTASNHLTLVWKDMSKKVVDCHMAKLVQHKLSLKTELRKWKIKQKLQICFFNKFERQKLLFAKVSRIVSCSSSACQRQWKENCPFCFWSIMETKIQNQNQIWVHFVSQKNMQKIAFSCGSSVAFFMDRHTLNFNWQIVICFCGQLCNKEEKCQKIFFLVHSTECTNC